MSETGAPGALEVKDLSTHINLSRSVVEAVGNVGFRIAPGETLGLVGESGSGKSMTGLSVLGLLPNGGHISGGSIKLGGLELVGLPERELQAIRGNEVAMIFQDSQSSLNPTMSIGRQVAEPVRLHRKASKREALDRAVEVLELVGLPQPRERLDDYPHQLSGGLRQRVMIAIALACEPKVLIADEPTTALDVTIQAQILALLDELEERLGMGTLLITHDMGVVAGRTDRINVMYAGRIVETAPTDRLFTSMRHPYTQALLGSIPSLEQDRTRALYTIPGLPPDLAPPPPGCRFAARCAHATDQCREHEPPLEGGDGHLFACWHPVDGPIARLPTIAPEEARRPPVLAPNGRHLLELDDVVREYPVTSGIILQRKVDSVKAVSGITLHVDTGETLGLVGESGCGKTTLGKLIVGDEKADSGSVELEGKRVFSLKPRALRRARRDLQMMFQDPYASLDPRMRVQAILREPLEIQKIGSRHEQDERITTVLREVGLPQNALERYPHEFSGGQRQRIGLARALMLDPKVIVADEPVSALDVSIRSQILNLMRRLQSERGTASVVISHDLAVVKYLSDRIGVMYLGKLVELGSGDDIYRRPAHPYTDALIKTIPVPDPAVKRADVAIRGELPSPRNPPSGCRFRTRCPRAQDLCAQREPRLRSFGPGHVAACHFPLQEALEQEHAVAPGEEVTFASWATVRRNRRVFGKGAYGTRGVLALSDEKLVFTASGSIQWEIERTAITAVTRPWYGIGSYITFEVNGDHYALAFGARRGMVALGSASDLAAEYGGTAGAGEGLIGAVIGVALIRRASRLGRQWFDLLSSS
jgi:oligopeptide/dipeptide ABC transporter ATP-binding protein